MDFVSAHKQTNKLKPFGNETTGISARNDFEQAACCVAQLRMKYCAAWDIAQWNKNSKICNQMKLLQIIELFYDSTKRLELFCVSRRK